MKFEYYVELKNGFRNVLDLEETMELRFVVEASCFANAQRMVKAMLKDAPNVVEFSGICIED